MEITCERDRLIIKCNGINAKLNELDPLERDQIFFRMRRMVSHWSKLLEGPVPFEDINYLTTRIHELYEQVSAFHAEKWKGKVCQP